MCKPLNIPENLETPERKSGILGEETQGRCLSSQKHLKILL